MTGEIQHGGHGAPLAQPRRIHILGGEATGKTTLSRRIGELIDAPVHNLDAIAWIIDDADAQVEVLDPRYQPSAAVSPRPLDECQRLVATLSEGAAWVTEGKYLDWTALLFERSDLIVFLDHVPMWRAVGHIVARAGRSAIREARRQRGHRRFLRVRDYARHSLELARQLYYRISYDARQGTAQLERAEPTRSAAVAALAPFRHKVVHVRRAGDLEALLTRLGAHAAEARAEETSS